jgi:hypothetical protein
MPPEFGVLKKIDLRAVWSKEATEFTPWLADNLTALGEVLGMELELQNREAACGDFSCDLLARDLGSNRGVVIENQLSSTDHDHLGKLITYASGLEAGVVVWIAPEIRDEHRQALDWLNQRTDANVDFFGVVVEVVKIDDSRPAFSLRPIAFPNQWRKGNIGSAGGGKPSERGEAYRQFFQALIDELRTVHKFTNARAGQPQNWYSFASGISSVTYGFTFAQGGQVRAEVYIDTEDVDENKALFDALLKEKVDIENEFGEALKWERLDHRRASRIAIYRKGAIDEAETLGDLRAWAVDRLLKVKKVFGARIADLAKQM